MANETPSEIEIIARGEMLKVRNLITKVTQECVDLSFEAGGEMITAITAASLNSAAIVLMCLRERLKEATGLVTESATNSGAEPPSTSK